MKYFTFDELTYSRTAVENGLSNRPGATERDNLAQLVERLLDPLRERLGEPIAILSGYRSPEVNTLVGGVPDSQHTLTVIAGKKVGQKTVGAVEKGLDAFHVGRTGRAAHLGDAPACQAAPVALTQQGAEVHRQAASTVEHLGRSHGPRQVAHHQRVERHAGQGIAQRLCLADAGGSQPTGQVPLQDTGDVLLGFAVAH